jgi:hypothetical protein
MSTTQENPESTSSDKMASSKPWTATVTLGQRIVRELGLDDGVNTLGRWMAHRVAELMQRAEQADTLTERESAKQECSELILRIWERRAFLLYGRPLAEVADFLKKFTSSSPRFDRHRTEPEEKTWNSILPILEALQEREDTVCRDAAIADLSAEVIEKEREWLTEHPEDLSPEESDTIQWLVEQCDRLSGDGYRLDRIPAANFASLPAPERTQLVHEALLMIETERKELLMSIESQDKTTDNSEDYSSHETKLSNLSQDYHSYEDPPQRC